MITSDQSPRLVNSELLDHLDPVERLIAKAFITEGRWKIKTEDPKE